ncbi:MAG: DUF4232 domain-containing protein [Actinomycetes bacterium]
MPARSDVSSRRLARTRLARAVVPVAAGMLALPLLAACGSSAPAPSAEQTSQAPALPASPEPTTAAPAAETTTSAAATSAAASETQSPSAPASSAAPGCSLDKLSVTPGGTDGGAGHEMDVFVVTNGGDSACTLTGYPAVTFRTAAGAKTAITITHEGDYTFPALTPKPVEVAPGGAASFAIGFTRAPEDDSQQCPTAQRMAVTLPGAARTTTLTVDVTACDQGRVAVSPIVSGANGPS